MFFKNETYLDNDERAEEISYFINEHNEPEIKDLYTARVAKRKINNKVGKLRNKLNNARRVGDTEAYAVTKEKLDSFRQSVKT